MLESLASPEGHAQLEATLFVWMPQQRWFAGKARELEHVRVVDTALLEGKHDVLEVIVRTAFADGHVEHYQVPLCPASRGIDEAFLLPGGELADATADGTAALTLGKATTSQHTQPTELGGSIQGRTVGDLDGRLERPRRMGAEQSNTSIVYGDRCILKLFRRLEEGVNPDVEMTAALTASGFRHVPAQRGSLTLHRAGSETSLAVLTDYLAGGREGWDLAVAEAEQVCRGELPPAGAPLLQPFRDLGEVIARMHLALRDVFGSRAMTPADATGWTAAMQRQAEAALGTAARIAPSLVQPVLDRRAAVLERLSRLDLGSGLPLVRIHGDLHLGQVMVDRQQQWQLLDFEGEPARSLSERRRLNAPLRDVAGMLRSFDYAAAQGAAQSGWTAGAAADLPPAVVAWRDDSRAAFLDGYVSVAVDPVLAGADQERWRHLLGIFELDKAVYELAYELANRPGWVAIPVGGILRVLGDGLTRRVNREG